MAQKFALNVFFRQHILNRYRSLIYTKPGIFICSTFCEPVFICNDVGGAESPNEEAQPNEASLHGGHWWSCENDCGLDPGASPSE